MMITLRESYRVQFHDEQLGWLNFRKNGHFSKPEPAMERRRELEEKVPKDFRVVKCTLQQELIE